MQTRILGFAALLAAATLGGAYVDFDIRAQPAVASRPTTPPAAAVAMPSAALPDFSSIVERNGAAVVNISVTGSMKNSLDGSEIGPGDPSSPLPRRFHSIPPHVRPVHSLGSGFIISPDGLILTDSHVLEGADEVTVRLTDRREFKAKVVGTDSLMDVAVLRIDATKLPVVRLGDPARVRVGEWVLAIGSPFGFESSVTAGIVSATGRALPDDDYVPFIQTDAAVNPGNSGGPLFNMSGEVIGINSQIYSRSGGYQGVSFAIPIDVAMRIGDQLVRHGKVSHGRLGVGIQEVSQPLADSFGLNRAEGALIGTVEKGSPAAKAGIESGDIILKLGDHPIAHSSNLPPLIASLKPGTSVKLEIWRKRERRQIVTMVGEAVPANAAESVSGNAATTAAAEKGRLGLAVRPLTTHERTLVDLDNGLLVERAAGAAARAGLRPNDVVVAFNGEPLKSADQLNALVSKAGKHAALLIMRNGAKIFVPVDLG